MQTLSATDIHNAPWIEPAQKPKEAIFKRLINYTLFQSLSCATSAFVRCMQLNRNEVVVVLSIRLVFESLACKEGILVGLSAKKVLKHVRGILKKK